MRVVYSPREDWDKYYFIQSGHGLPGFAGTAFQRGGGLGNFLGRLFRFVLPVAKKVGKSVGKQALTTGADILGDVIQGKNLKASTKARGTAALRTLGRKAANTMRQKGAGRIGVRQKPRKSRAKRSAKIKTGRGRLGRRPKTIKGPATLKRKRTSISSRVAKRRNFLENVEVN